MKRLALALAATLACTGVCAQDELQPGDLSEYTEYDRNNDGVVMLSEIEMLVSSTQMEGVRACDKNHDLKLSLLEYNICNGRAPDPEKAESDE
jgi:hypothetical protein